jgi:hypothetical protein
MNYEALIALSIATWRIIAAIRDPILHPLRDILKKQNAKWGNYAFNWFVWGCAWLIGYVYATMAGEGGNALYMYEFVGHGITALFIASASAGLRIGEKWFYLAEAWLQVASDDKVEKSIEDMKL